MGRGLDRLGPLPSALLMSSRLAFAISVMATAIVAAQQPPAQAPLFFATSSELVVLPVVVAHGDGNFVTGLTRDQFSVFDDGRKQEVSLFSDADSPVTLGLVIDDSSSMGPKLGEVIAAALALARSSNPDDRIFAVDFNDRVHEVIAEPIFARDIHGLDRALTTLVPEGRTALYDAIVAALDREADAADPARKVLVVISDGGDNASRAKLDEVLARARKASVTIYTIGLFDEGDPDRDPGVLKKLAAETGGERFLPASPGPLMRDVEHIAREIRSGYTIGYVPPARDGRYHRVRVTIEAPQARRASIRTRPGYFAPSLPGRSR